MPCRMGYPPPPAMMAYAQQQQQQQAQHQPQQPPPQQQQAPKQYTRPVVKPAARRAIKIVDPNTGNAIQLGPEHLFLTAPDLSTGCHISATLTATARTAAACALVRVLCSLSA